MATFVQDEEVEEDLQGVSSSDRPLDSVSAIFRMTKRSQAPYPLKVYSMDDHCHREPGNPPFAVRNPYVDLGKSGSNVRRPEMKLELILWSGKPFDCDSDLKAIERAIHKRSGTRPSGVQKVDGAHIVVYSAIEQAKKADGLVIGTDERSFKLARTLTSLHRVFSCRNIPFGVDGVSQVEALHSILSIVPGEAPLSVFLKALAGCDKKTSKPADLVVVLRDALPLRSFSFELEIRSGDGAAASQSFKLNFTPDTEDKKGCSRCNPTRRNKHHEEHCPKLVALLLNDGRGANSRLRRRPSM